MILVDQLIGVPGQLTRTLRSVEELTLNTRTIISEFKGMRADIVALGKQVEGLREDVRALGADVAPMRSTMEMIDGRIQALALDLDGVGALAGRFGRFGRRRPADQA